MNASEDAGDESARIEEEAVRWLASLRGGHGDQAGFERWYSENPAHAQAYDQLLASWDAMALLTPAVPLANEQESASPNGRDHRRTIIMAIAAVLILGIFAIGIGGPGWFGAQPATAVALSSKVGEIRQVRLADGSIVTLDSDSAISGSLSAASRTLRLVRGRVRFELAAANPTPLVVETDAGTVSGSQGSFDVGLREGILTAASLRGGLDIRRAGASQHVAVGQIIASVPNDGLGDPRMIRASEMRWTTGMLSFENDRLVDVIAGVNRYGVTKIVVRGEAGDLRFTGTIRPTRTDAVAHMLAATFDLDLGHDTAGNYVLALRQHR